jgi:hypothetical protein
MDRLMWIAILLLSAAALLEAGRASSHEAVVIDVENGNGVLAQICTTYAYTKYPNDPEKAQLEAQACYDWAAGEMYPKEYVHGHS